MLTGKKWENVIISVRLSDWPGQKLKSFFLGHKKYECHYYLSLHDYQTEWAFFSKTLLVRVSDELGHALNTSDKLFFKGRASDNAHVCIWCAVMWKDALQVHTVHPWDALYFWEVKLNMNSYEVSEVIVKSLVEDCLLHDSRVISLVWFWKISCLVVHLFLCRLSFW